MSRVSPGLILILFFGALIGLAGFYLWKKSQVPVLAAVAPKQAPRFPVFIVASTDLPAGRVVHPSDFMSVTINPDELKNKRWPQVLMADGNQIVNRRLRREHKQGEPFSPEVFYPEGIEPNLTELLPPGMCAIPLSISNDGLPTKTTPGALVDVVIRTVPDEKAHLPELTQTLVERVRVLSIGSNATPGAVGDANNNSARFLVTLAVDSMQALRLKATEKRGEFVLVLRNENDLISSGIQERVTLKQIFDLQEPPVAPEPFVAEIYRRGQRNTVTFDGQGRIVANGATGNPPSSRAGLSHSRDVSSSSPANSSRDNSDNSNFKNADQPFGDENKSTPSPRNDLQDRDSQPNNHMDRLPIDPSPGAQPSERRMRIQSATLSQSELVREPSFNSTSEMVQSPSGELSLISWPPLKEARP